MSSREFLSPRLIAFRATTTWDPVEAEELARRARTTERRRNLLRRATSDLDHKERVLVEAALAEKSEEQIRQEMGVERVELEEIMSNSILKITKKLQGKGAPRLDAELQRQARSLGISENAKPDRVTAAKLLNRTHCQASYIEMSPGLALALLERNTNNRRLDPRRVETYARDMANGDWHPNNQGVAIGVDNLLHDGQHRLWAVAKAGCDVRMLVVAGASTEARGTIDQGRSRSIGDGLQILDGQTRGNAVISWLRAIDLLLNKRTAPMSLSVARRELSRYEPSVAWFKINGPRARPYARSSVVGALIYAHAASPEHVEGFTRRYVSGAQLEEGSPVLALRGYVAERMQRDADTPRAISLKTLRCVVADAHGEQLHRIPAAEEGLAHFRELHSVRLGTAGQAIAEAAE
ncbi:MAG TPA: hypothetical protein VG963_07905 [Polyangiaceae bacterium]|nr:hypothetical protein [Polyangiaceae bacterium]